MAKDDGVVSLADARRSAGEQSGETEFRSEIWARLTHATDTGHFVNSWLDIQARALDGIIRGVVVLRTNELAAFAPVAVWPEQISGSPTLAGVVERSLNDRSVVVEGLRRGSRDEPIFLAHPVIVDEELLGAVGLEISGRSEAAVRLLVQQLGWGIGWLETLAYRKSFTSKARLVTVLELIATSLRHERFQAAATAVATDLATMFGCERVSIGFMKGKHAEVHALSHSAAFSKKSNLMRDIESAMEEAADQLATVVIPPRKDAPFQVTQAHEALARQHGVGAVCTVPLTTGAQVLGAMLLELPSGQEFDARTVELCEHAAQLVGPVLDVKRRDDRWLAEKALDSARLHVRRLAGPGHTGLKLGVGLGVFGLLFLLLAQGDYRVTADAALEGVIQRAVTAPVPGYVAEARVRPGDVVKAGDVLAVLDDRDLRLERTKLAGQLAQRQSEYADAMAERQRAKIGMNMAQQAQVEAQLALVDEQLKRMSMVAPFDAVVVKGDLSQSLGAPVERGSVLFELAPLDSYRIIMKVDERDIEAIVPKLTGVLALASLPSQEIPLVVDKITPVSVVDQGRNYFRVEAVAQGGVDQLRPGMEGVGKILVDQRSLFWIWTHKLTHWIRMWFWTWLP